MPEERPPLEPIQLAPQLHHVANDRHCRGTDLGLGSDIGNGGQRALNGLRAAGRAAADQGHRGICRQPVADERVGDLADAVRAQHDDFGPRTFRHVRPINAVVSFRRVLVAGKKGKLGGKLAMSQRDPGVVGRRHER